MTELERNARYSYIEKLLYLKKQGYDSTHLRTMSYNGYKVIMLSRLGKGVRYFFYKKGTLIKMRSWNWKNDIRKYAQNYIDQVLNTTKN